MKIKIRLPRRARKVLMSDCNYSAIEILKIWNAEPLNVSNPRIFSEWVKPKDVSKYLAKGWRFTDLEIVEFWSNLRPFWSTLCPFRWFFREKERAIPLPKSNPEEK